jgi:aminoglycoside 6'-N-acetyltransferase
MPIRLRRATLDDVPLLRRWDEDPDVVSSDPNDDWHWEEELAHVSDWREPLIAEEDGRPVGFLDIIDPFAEPSRYWGEVPAGLRAIDIWIGAADDRGRGLGTEMMRQAIAKCFAPADVTAIVIDPLASNVRAIRFYERLGFTPVERRLFGEDDCLVMRLERPRADCR